jgi:hypothetical protein
MPLNLCGYLAVTGSNWVKLSLPMHRSTQAMIMVTEIYFLKGGGIS